MIKQRFLSLQDCLFNAYANQHFCNPQDEKYFWAIKEGFKRLYRYSYQWEMPTSRKEHECVRGCTIKEGDTYFKQSTGVGYSDNIKICASCMAMILYYRKVYELDEVWYSYWDIELNQEIAAINKVVDDF